ncbi:hypothetical protein BDZ89DRAFT_248645 [Hymenopellis radicata]|nr:hypothetical protein BDZ89DRAFT_248645 [Hymenopellis radicata]
MLGAPPCKHEDFIIHMSSSLQFSITICSHAQDLQQKVLDLGHSYTTRWQMLYCTFFSAAWRCSHKMELRYNPPWVVHGELRAGLISLNHQMRCGRILYSLPLQNPLVAGMSPNGTGSQQQASTGTEQPVILAVN